MNIFRSYTFEWWQVSLIKVCLISLGVMIGAHWSVPLKKWMTLWAILFIVPALYFIYVWFMQ